MASRLAVLSVVVCDLSFAGPPPGYSTGSYVEYSGGPDGTSSDMEVEHRWVTMPADDELEGHVTASTQFKTEAGIGGYVGAQVWSGVPAAGRGKVIFAMQDAGPSNLVSWDASSPGGENCERDGNVFPGFAGAHCSMSYPLRRGEKLTLGVVMGDGGRRMTGTVTDSNGFMTIIGTLVFPDLSDFHGFGLLQHKAATGSLVYSGGNCSNALSAVGLTGPWWQQRSILPNSAVPDYNADCPNADVHACILPGGECGPPHAFLLSGGNVKQQTSKGVELWSLPYPGSEVSCGADHLSDSCANCDQGRGSTWCSGDCQWRAGSCVPLAGLATAIAV